MKETKTMHKILLSIVASFMLLFVAACASDVVEEDDSVNEDNVPSETVSDDTGETDYPLVITDATDTEVTIEEEPEKIISVSTSDTETLFALGLNDEIVGVSDFDNYPEEALDKTKVGSVVEPNIEAILEQEPDLVIVGNSIMPDSVEKIRELDIPVYQTDPKNMDETVETMTQLAVITNTQQAGEKIVNDIEEQLTAITDTVANVSEEDKKKVYIEFNPGWTVGSGEFMDELIDLAGGINIANDQEGWIEINEEKIIEADPEYILYADHLIDEETNKPLDELIKERSGWEEITAIKNDQLIPLDEDIISRNGPRIIIALQNIAEGIYPELFE